MRERCVGERTTMKRNKCVKTIHRNIGGKDSRFSVTAFNNLL